MASRLYSTTKAAEYLGVSRYAMKYYIRSGRLQALGIGTLTPAGWIFTEEELDRLRAAIRPYRRRTGDDHGTQPGRDR